MQINVPFSADGEACVSAANQFYAQEDVCTNNYRLLGELSTITSVQTAAGAICTSNTCRDRLTSFADLLYACRAGDLYSDDNDDDDDDDVCNKMLATRIQLLW